MNPNLFLAPATSRGEARRYFDRAVLDGVPVDVLEEAENIPEGDTPSVWGLTSNLESEWENVDAGDWLLFYTRSTEYEYAARVLGTENVPDVGDRIRERVLNAPSDEDRDWNFLLYLDEPVRVSVSGERVADVFGYRNNFPVRFMGVTDERWESQDEYGDVESFIADIRVE